MTEETPQTLPEAVEPAMQEVTSVAVADLVVLIRFLSNLSMMNRLSEIESNAIKPSFDAVAAFLATQERLAQQQANENQAEPVVDAVTASDIAEQE